MRGILIDPYNETVTEVDYKGPYTEIYKFLSSDEKVVDLFTVVNIEDGESLYVDDEGLLTDPTHFFKYGKYPQPLAGKGLILGVDEEGETVATSLMLDAVKAKVVFMNDIALSHMESFSGKTKHPVFGEVDTFGSRPVFVTRPRDNEKG